MKNEANFLRTTNKKEHTKINNNFLNYNSKIILKIYQIIKKKSNRIENCRHEKGHNYKKNKTFTSTHTLNLIPATKVDNNYNIKIWLATHWNYCGCCKQL